MSRGGQSLRLLLAADAALRPAAFRPIERKRHVRNQFRSAVLGRDYRDRRNCLNARSHRTVQPSEMIWRAITAALGIAVGGFVFLPAFGAIWGVL